MAYFLLWYARDLLQNYLNCKNFDKFTKFPKIFINQKIFRNNEIML